VRFCSKLCLMAGPQPGDLVIIGTVSQQWFVEADARHVAGPFDTFDAAHKWALARGKNVQVWNQPTDARGRPFGMPARLTPAPPPE
jgi:hypothetical protein